MKQQLSRERLNQLHEALDRELQSIDHMHLLSPPAAPITIPFQAPLKPAPTHSKPSNTQLEDLQKKLLHLEKKMEKINLSSEQEDSFEIKKSSKQASIQNSSKKLKNPKEEEIPSQKTIKERSAVKSGKKKTIEMTIDAEDSPLKRKYQGDSGLKQSPRAKLKKPQRQKSMDKSHKDNRLSLSRKSMDQMSVRSTKSLNKNLTSAQQYSRIEQLEQDLRRYKHQNKKLRLKVKGLQMIEVKYEKLKQNFEKSEIIRKQQKVMIQNYKNKLKNADD